MRGLLFVILAFILAYLQADALNYIRIFSSKPDLLLIVTIFVALNSTRYRPIVFALFCGLLKDSLSFATFGLNSFSFCCIAIVVSILNKGLYFESHINYILLVFICALFNSIVNYIYFFHLISFPVFLRMSFFSITYTAIIAIYLFRFLRRFVGGFIPET